MSVLDNVHFEQGSVYRYILMEEESITLNFTYDGDAELPFGLEYTLGEIEGLPKSSVGKYVLLSSPTKNTDGLSNASRYSVRLDKEYFKTKNYIIKYMPKTGGAEASWSLTAHLDVFAEVLKKNFESADCGIDTVEIDMVKMPIENGDGVIEEKDVIFASGAMNLSFSSTPIFDAIGAIANAWSCEWWVEGRTLHFGKCTRQESVTFSYDVNVESSAPIQAKQVPNKFYVFGSTDNIPYWYKKEVNTDGVELTFNNYRHYLDTERVISLSPFGTQGNQSLVYEGQQSVFVYWGKKCNGLSKGEYVQLDFSNTSVIITKDDDAKGRVRAYLQYSEDNKKYITLDSYYVNDTVGSMVYHKTKTFLKVESGEIYLRLYLEFESDGDNKYGHFNASVNFTPKVHYVLLGDLKNYTLPHSCFITPDYDESEYGDMLKSAVVQNRLMLDKPIDKSNGGMVVESVLVFDDVKPKSLCTTTVLDPIEYVDEIELADGSKEKQSWKAYRIKAPEYIDENAILSGKTLAIHFESGALAGMEFDVAYDPDGIGDERDERTHVLEIIRNDRYGRYLPDATLKPSGTFYMLNFDISSVVTPSGESINLLSEAEEELKKTADEYIDKMYKQVDNMECTMRVDNDKAYEIGTSVNADFANHDDMRVISMEIPLDIPYDHPKYTLGQQPSYSSIGTLKEEIESVAKDGGSYMSGANIYIIRTLDTNPATNDNVYSAKRSDWNYISKQNDDSVKGLITFAQGLVSMGIIRSVGKIITLQSVESSDYKKSEQGFFLGSETIDRGSYKKAESVLEVDRLYVRNAIQYAMLNVKKRTYIEGSLAVTCGAAELIKVYSYEEAQKRIKDIEQEMLTLGDATVYEVNRNEELDEERKTYIGMKQGAYRCWFKNEEDGIKINNDFVVGDMAMKETLNLEHNTYYWRKVVGVGSDYVDLSATDYDKSKTNNAPQAGDIIVQLGHVSDKSRQNAIFINAVDSNAPSIITYHGIDTYSLSSHEAIKQEFDVNSGTMKLTVYGDCYIGDKNESNYLKFSQTGGLDVKTNNLSFLVSGESGNKMTSIAEFKANVDNGIAQVEQKVSGTYKSIEEAVENGKKAIKETESTSMASINAAAGQGKSTIEATAKTKTDEVTKVGTDATAAIGKKITDAEATLKTYTDSANSSALLAATYESRAAGSASVAEGHATKASTQAGIALNAAETATSASLYVQSDSAIASVTEKICGNTSYLESIANKISFTADQVSYFVNNSSYNYKFDDNGFNVVSKNDPINPSAVLDGTTLFFGASKDSKGYSWYAKDNVRIHDSRYELEMTSSRISIYDSDEHKSVGIDTNGVSINGKKITVVSSLPSSPDSDTIYIVIG